MSKISGLINDRERQIAWRVRRVRQLNWLSQPEFAKALGESVNRIASIEYARTPLVVEVADKIAAKFDVSLKWLKTGQGRMKPTIGLFSVFCPEIKVSTLLSNASTDTIEKKSAEVLKFNYLGMDVILHGGIVLPKGMKQKHIVQSFHDYFNETFYELPHEGKEKLLALAMRTISKFDYDWMRGNRKTPGENITMEPTPNTAEDNNFKTMLSKTATIEKHDAVENQWMELKRRIQKSASNSGVKSMLAKFLGVDLPQLSKWLTDSKSAREPGAEYTLKMLYWIEQQERQK